MEFRNAVKTADGRVDCEINHPVYGWIPFTADQNDTEPLGRAVFNAANPVADEAAADTAQANDPVPPSVSRFQALAALMDAGLLADVGMALADAGPLAQLAWAEASEFRRNSPMILTMADGLGLTDDDVDALFRAAAQIEV